VHDRPTDRVLDLDALLSSVTRSDEHAATSADALVSVGPRGIDAVVAALPGPLTLDRHTLRGTPPPLGKHGPLLALLGRFGAAAAPQLVTRLGDASADVRYYATLALGELNRADVVAPLGKRLYDADAGVRQAAVQALVRMEPNAELRRLTESLRGDLPGPDSDRQRYAAEALGALRDAEAVPRLVELVKDSDAELVAAARSALVEITKQDFGTSRWRWRSWWERHRDEPRVEWMLEGLGHSEADVRMSAAAELSVVTGQNFGYHFDLPKREREEARKRWVEWWREHGERRL
jgi:hypothetical protein